MPKLAKPIQGLIVIVLAVIVGFGLLQVVNNNEDEGFLGITKSETIVTPLGTEEPDDGAGVGATEEPSDGGESEDSSPPAPTTTSTIDFKSPLGADANLLFQVFMFFGLIFGASFAVRKDFTSHRNIMTFLILVNWFSIIGRMTGTFGDRELLDISDNLIYVHAGLGSIVMIFASYLAIRMWFENQLPAALKIEPIKPWMRLTLVAWLALIILGFLIYSGLYS